MSRYELTPLGKVVRAILMIIIVCAVGFVGFNLYQRFTPTTDETESEQVSESKAETDVQQSGNKQRDDTDEEISKLSTSVTQGSNVINISLDEWVGWKSIIDANGGLTTKEGSIFDQKGLKVNISVINDATQSSNALISGSLNAAGYTINRTAFLSQKFTDANVDIIMPFITNYSNGGDGIIATKDFQTVDSLIDAKIGIPQFSEAQTLVMYLLNNSDLTDEQINKIVNENFVYFDTPDEVAKAFFAGHVDVAATWEPYLSQAKSMSSCHVLFSTEASRNLIMDGIVFRKDFAEENPETIEKFIDGVLEAAPLYKTDFDAVREVFPMFSGSSDNDIINTANNADLCTWSDNKDILSDSAKTIYYNMCEIWSSLGEQVNLSLMDTLFDTTYIDGLEDVYGTVVEETTDNQKTVTTVTDENKQEIIDSQALLQKKVTINFDANTCNFSNTAEAAASLEEFIEIAKTLDGAIIQIEGNVADDVTTEENKYLSEQRAETIKKYFVMNGIDGRRIITVGNGADKPVLPNRNPDGSLSKEGTDANRRTDIYFKIVELSE